MIDIADRPKVKELLLKIAELSEDQQEAALDLLELMLRASRD